MDPSSYHHHLGSYAAAAYNAAAAAGELSRVFCVLFCNVCEILYSRCLNFSEELCEDVPIHWFFSACLKSAVIQSVQIVS